MKFIQKENFKILSNAPLSLICILLSASNDVFFWQKNCMLFWLILVTYNLKLKHIIWLRTKRFENHRKAPTGRWEYYVFLYGNGSNVLFAKNSQEACEHIILLSKYTSRYGDKRIGPIYQTGFWCFYDILDRGKYKIMKIFILKFYDIQLKIPAEETGKISIFFSILWYHVYSISFLRYLDYNSPIDFPELSRPVYNFLFLVFFRRSSRPEHFQTCR